MREVERDNERERKRERGGEASLHVRYRSPIELPFARGETEVKKSCASTIAAPHAVTFVTRTIAAEKRNHRGTGYCEMGEVGGWDGRRYGKKVSEDRVNQ